MHYHVGIQPHDKHGKRVGDWYFLYDYILPGLIPEHVLEMMRATYVREQLGLCHDCQVAYQCHVIEHPTGRKYCPVLFHDAVKPAWRIEDLV
jgi:hypothetical protein